MRSSTIRRQPSGLSPFADVFINRTIAVFQIPCQGNPLIQRGIDLFATSPLKTNCVVDFVHASSCTFVYTFVSWRLNLLVFYTAEGVSKEFYWIFVNISEGFYFLNDEKILLERAPQIYRIKLIFQIKIIMLFMVKCINI